MMPPSSASLMPRSSRERLASVRKLHCFAARWSSSSALTRVSTILSCATSVVHPSRLCGARAASVRRAGQGTQGRAWRGARAATHLRHRKQGARAGLANTRLATVDEQAAQLTHSACLTDGKAALVQ